MTSSEEYVIHGPRALEVPRVSMGRFLLDRLQSFGTKVCQVNAATGETTSFADVLERSVCVAQALQARGLMVGDVVGLASENCLEFCLPMLAAYYLGATCATFSPYASPRELAHALGISRPRLVFCSAGCEEKVSRLARDLPFVQEVVVLAPRSAAGNTPFPACLAPGPLPPPVFQAVPVHPDQHVAAVLCSSGTTGLPKGVMLSALNIITCVLGLSDPSFGDLDASVRHLMVIPMFHSYGYLVQLASLTIGFTSVIMVKFEPELFLSSIQKYKVNLLFVVPALMVFLAKDGRVDAPVLAGVRELWCGSAPLRADLQRQVEQRLGVCGVRQGYGMTETTMGVVNTPRGRAKPGSAGCLAPGTSAKVVDLETGELLGPNKMGELCFRSPLNMKGYCGDLRATIDTIDVDGFIHSGDVGYYDKDHYFYIVDRVKELIKYKSFQVPPAELEAVLLSHPAVQDAAVVGVPHEEAGELPRAFVVKQAGASVTEEDLIQFVAGQVSPHKRLRGGLHFIDAIPKTASGKILRKDLKNTHLSKL
ncbi:luciferin 4-monooxygenase-like [Bacillus rossius redtenbacheri]|uniref:luciferin 4-monooxygenase-like n=1 Tax=Bacillus rossius redtenbacheri TaxID=93214 RepID=UPI002FDEF4C7